MNFELGDVIAGLEYAGDTGVVQEIRTNGLETIYVLQTSRYDGYSSTLDIGFDKDNKLKVKFGGFHGGAYWREAKWNLKKIGNQPVSYPNWYTIFKDEEPERD